MPPLVFLYFLLQNIQTNPGRPGSNLLHSSRHMGSGILELIMSVRMLCFSLA